MRFLGTLLSWKYVLWLLVCVLVPSALYAQPQIAAAVVGDEYVHGNQMFITGNYFGNKPNNGVPKFWATFEEGSHAEIVGSPSHDPPGQGRSPDIGNYRYYFGQAGFCRPYYSNNHKRSSASNTMGIRAHFGQNYNADGGPEQPEGEVGMGGCWYNDIGTTFGDSREVYLDFWAATDWPQNKQSRSHKIARIWSTGESQPSDNANLFFGKSCPGGERMSNEYAGIKQREIVACTGGRMEGLWFSGSGSVSPTQDGAWQHWQIWAKGNPPFDSGCNDYLYMWIDCQVPLSSTGGICPVDGAPFQRHHCQFWASNNYTSPWNHVMIITQDSPDPFDIDACDNATFEHDQWIDDVYVDTNPARVEIGNASSYSSCTLRAIQIPSSWSISEIQITLNQDTFSAGEQFWVYVTDVSNNTSSGFGPILWEQGAAVPCAGYPH